MMVVSVRTLAGLQVDSIAAVAIGGVSIYGGRGTILGVLFGVLILAVIDSGLGALGASTEVQNTVKGAIIILAVSVEYFRRGPRADRITA
jgi:ribose/xylose/arabinose/galactoside ABC-type transport system permease subunit